jgi:hypothetical protein
MFQHYPNHTREFDVSSKGPTDFKFTSKLAFEHPKNRIQHERTTFTMKEPPSPLRTKQITDLRRHHAIHIIIKSISLQEVRKNTLFSHWYDLFLKDKLKEILRELG